MNHKNCPLHGIHCKRPRTAIELLIWKRAHSGIPRGDDFDSLTVRYGKTRRDHRSGAHARRLANRVNRATTFRTGKKG